MRVPTLAATAASVLLACTSSLLAQTPSTSSAAANPTVAYVYAGLPSNSSSSTASKIYAYSVQQDGTLKTVSGSPFTGPAGVGTPGSLVATAGHLYGTDGTHIATYARSSTGALHMSSEINGTAHNDTPAPNSSSFAMTLDRTNTSMYVGEIDFQGADNNAYAEFGIGSTGALSFKANSSIDVNDGDQLEFSGNNQFAYGQGCYFADWEVFGFARAANGSLSSFDTGFQYPNAPSPYVYCPVAMSTSGHGYLADGYISNQPNTFEKIGVYQILGSGRLDLVTNSTITVPFAFGTIRFDPSGNYLAVAGNGIAVYQLTSSKTLKKLGSTLDTSATFTDVRWDNYGHLYAVTKTALYVFNLKSGVLTANGSAHSLSKSGPLDLAVFPLK